MYNQYWLDFDQTLLKEISRFCRCTCGCLCVCVRVCVPSQACDLSCQRAVRHRAEHEGRISDYGVSQLVYEQTELWVRQWPWGNQPPHSDLTLQSDIPARNHLSKPDSTTLLNYKNLATICPSNYGINEVVGQTGSQIMNLKWQSWGLFLGTEDRKGEIVN